MGILDFLFGRNRVSNEDSYSSNEESTPSAQADIHIKNFSEGSDGSSAYEPNNASYSTMPISVQMGILIDQKKVEEAIDLGEDELKNNPEDCYIHIQLMIAYFHKRNISPEYLEKSNYHAKQAMIYGHNTGCAEDRLAKNLDKAKCFNQSLQLYSLILDEPRFEHFRSQKDHQNYYTKRKANALKNISKAIDSKDCILFTPEEKEKIIQGVINDEIRYNEAVKRVKSFDQDPFSYYFNQKAPTKPSTSLQAETFDASIVNFVAIDLETANSFRGSICQIGITEVINGVIQPSKSWLVKPKGNRYDSINIAIHGITPKDTENAPEFPEVWKIVYPLLKEKLVVAHNTSFDMYALRDAFDLYKMAYPTFDYFCTLRIARYIVKGCYSYSLDIVLEHLNIEFSGHHKAGNDSMGCAKLLLKCLEIDGSSLEELESKYNFKRGKFAPNLFIPHLKNKIYKNKKKELIDNLVESPVPIDEGNYFYGKYVCFTGTCKFGLRKDLLQKVKDVGGIPTDTVTSKTNVLVVGQQDYRVVGDDGMSAKQKRALQLLEKGNDIEILSEQEFITRI